MLRWLWDIIFVELKRREEVRAVLEGVLRIEFNEEPREKMSTT